MRIGVCRPLMVVAAIVAGTVGLGVAPASAEVAGPVATAVVRSQAGTTIGEVTFQGLSNGRVQVTATMAGLVPANDFHGFHIHANGVCDGDFTSAGGHWNPAGATHGDHQGDMPVLYADAAGSARATTTLDASPSRSC